MHDPDDDIHEPEHDHLLDQDFLDDLDAEHADAFDGVAERADDHEDPGHWFEEEDERDHPAWFDECDD
ncbi:hypothetical protein [Pseudomonas sp. Marseille-QA0332]